MSSFSTACLILSFGQVTFLSISVPTCKMGMITPLMGLWQESNELKVRSKTLGGCDYPDDPATLNSAGVWHILKFRLFPFNWTLTPALDSLRLSFGFGILDCW